MTEPEYRFAEKNSVSDQQIKEALALWMDLLIAGARERQQKEEAVAKLPPPQKDTRLSTK